MKLNYKILISMLIIAISLIGITAASASVYDTDSPYLRVIAQEVSPEPVAPGQDVTVKIRLINEGGDSANDVSLKLNANPPFFVKTQSNDFKNKQSLCVGCSIDTTYYLILDANAKSGLYSLDFEISRDGLVIKSQDTVNIKVVGEPDVILESKSIKTNVSSGDEFILNFEARNIGTGIARNIKITPQSDKILMLGSNINLISEIDPNTTVLFNSEFIIKESLTPDTYKFPIKLEYVDEQGNNYDTSFNIGVNVLNRASIGFQNIKITPVMPTLVDEVHMEGMIENTGTGDGERVMVELITSDGKTYQSFIGQLKADDDSPFYFDAKPESVGMQRATLRISYDDDFGSHTYETTLDKEVLRPTNNVIISIIIILILLTGMGFVYYKKKKAKTNKNVRNSKIRNL